MDFDVNVVYWVHLDLFSLVIAVVVHVYFAL